MSIAAPITGQAPALSVQASPFSKGLAKLQVQYDQAENSLRKGARTSSLPPLITTPQEWESIRKDSEAIAPYKAELLSTIREVRTFIQQHAQTGEGRKFALDGLSTFEDCKVNASASKLKLATFGQNRQNLVYLTGLLKNEDIPLQKRVATASDICKGLGVCEEGEALNIQEAIGELEKQTRGLSAKVVNSKNDLIQQHLQTLVKHETKDYSNRKTMEIHHVQTLKNMLASEWGLMFKDDPHATVFFQRSRGDMARVMLNRALTPASLAKHIASEIHQLCSAEWGTQATKNYDQEAVDTLSAVLTAEMGDDLNLHDVLDTNEDYTEVRLKSHTELSALVLEKFKSLGLVDQDANCEALLAEKEVDTLELVKSLSHLRKPDGSDLAYLESKITGNKLVAEQHAKDNQKREEEYKKQAEITRAQIKAGVSLLQDIAKPFLEKHEEQAEIKQAQIKLGVSLIQDIARSVQEKQENQKKEEIESLRAKAGLLTQTIYERPVNKSRA